MKQQERGTRTDEAPKPYEPVRAIAAEALLQELRSGVPLTIVDVRERPEVLATGTLADARMFPFHQFAARLEELDLLRRKRVVVVSQRGVRALDAARELHRAGFLEVAVLEGGLQRWLELDHPVEVRRESSIPPRPSS